MTFASVDKNEHEKKPVVYVARLGDDVSFIPYARDDRMLNFSRFDIDGVDNVLAEDLDAFVFTERGVYRPGDEMHIGFVIKQRNWQGRLAGLPVETEVIDARDLKVQTKKLALPAGWFRRDQLQHRLRIADRRIHDQRLPGEERQALDAARLDHRERERVPARSDEDRDAALENFRARLGRSERDAGFDCARESLRHAGHRIGASRATSSFRRPVSRFRNFATTAFTIRCSTRKRNGSTKRSISASRRRMPTARAEFDLQLDRFADATYAMQFFAEAFEGEGGRSITGQASVLVSALPYVVGYKADGDLNYINANTPRAVEFARGRSAAQTHRGRERDAGCRSRRNTFRSSRKRKTAATVTNRS